MQRFFFDNETIVNDSFDVVGEKYKHIVKVLRISAGERVVFCDGKGTDYLCEFCYADSQKAEFKVISSELNKTEPELKITLFQCLPKGDKLDDAVKRCVQFGINKIVPVLSDRCVSRPDSKAAAKKVERLNKISRSSAMQSMRGVIPEVSEVVSFKTAVEMMKQYPSSYICYELEKDNLISKMSIDSKEVAFLIGPEGGLDVSEIELAKQNGIIPVSLGKRILRTEDAAQFVIPIMLAQTNNL